MNSNTTVARRGHREKFCPSVQQFSAPTAMVSCFLVPCAMRKAVKGHSSVPCAMRKAVKGHSSVPCAMRRAAKGRSSVPCAMRKGVKGHSSVPCAMRSAVIIFFRHTCSPLEWCKRAICLAGCGRRYHFFIRPPNFAA